jgi:WD40 repeat protein
VDWTADGARLLTAQPDGVITIWEANSAPAVSIALFTHAMTVATTTPTTSPAAPPPTNTPRSANPPALPNQIALQPFQNELKPAPAAKEWTTWSPRGTYLLVSGAIGDPVKVLNEARVFEAASGKDILTLPSVLSGSWSPDERLLAFCTNNGDGSITLYVRRIGAQKELWSSRSPARDLVNGKPAFPPRPSTVAFSPDGRQIAERRLDGTIVLYDSESGKILGQFLTGSGAVGARLLAWNPRGDSLALDVGGDAVQIWTVQRTPSLTTTLYNFTGGLAWSHDGQFLAVGTDRTRIFVYDGHSGDMAYVLNGHEHRIFGLGWSEGDRDLFSYEINELSHVPTAIVWQIATRQPVANVTTYDVMTTVNWTQVGSTNRVMVESVTGGIAVWDGTGNNTHPVNLTLPANAQAYVPAALSPDGRLLALMVVTDQGATLEVRDAGTDQILISTGLPQIASDDNWTAPVWSPNSQDLYVSATTVLYLYHLK